MAKDGNIADLKSWEAEDGDDVNDRRLVGDASSLPGQPGQDRVGYPFIDSVNPGVQSPGNNTPDSFEGDVPRGYVKASVGAEANVRSGPATAPAAGVKATNNGPGRRTRIDPGTWPPETELTGGATSYTTGTPGAKGASD